MSIERKLYILNMVFDSYKSKPTTVPTSGELEYKCVNDRCSSHLKNKNKFCINIHTENAHCWVCGLKVGNIARIIKENGQTQYFDEWVSLSTQKFKKFKGKQKEPEAEHPVIYYDNIINTFPEIYNLSKEHVARQYLIARCISLRTAKQFNIRFADDVFFEKHHLSQMICIPSHSERGIDYLFFRSINNSFKYNPAASSKNKIIFNDLLINWKEPVVLVEGVFDALRMFEYNQAIPLLGSSLSKKMEVFKKIIQEKPDVVVCLDPDAFDKQMFMMDMLFKWGINVFSMRLQREDISSSTDEEISDAFENITKYNTTFKTLYKLYE